MSGTDRIPDPDGRPRWLRRITPPLGIKPSRVPPGLAEKLAEITACDTSDARRWCLLLAASRAGKSWLASLIGMIAVVMWLWVMAFGGMGVPPLLEAVYDAIERGMSEGPVRTTLFVTLTITAWIIIPVALSIAADRLIWRRWLIKTVCSRAAQPRCFTCNYDC